MAVFRNFKTGFKLLIQVHHENCTAPVSQLANRLNFESRARAGGGEEVSEQRVPQNSICDYI